VATPSLPYRRWDEDEDVGERWREVWMGMGTGGCDVDMRGDWVRRKEKRFVE
jgi:hypothetical protein